jgi:NAD(P)H-hydrate repair Nnr-like enzyme with NAD(P)H-hydrate epimerase domain
MARPRSRDRLQLLAPASTRLWPDQAKEIDWAAQRLGVSRSRLLRSAALTVARELREGAEQPLKLHF